MRLDRVFIIVHTIFLRGHKMHNTDGGIRTRRDKCLWLDFISVKDELLKYQWNIRAEKPVVNTL